jgi:hypothetical protein
LETGSLGLRTPTCRLAAAHRACQGLEPRRGLPKAPLTCPSTARRCLPRSPAFARRLSFGKRLEPSDQGSTVAGSRCTAPTPSRLARSKRRASVARQARTRRWSVRNGPSGNVPGGSCCQRARNSFAVPSGLASSQARTVGHTSSNASLRVRPWRGGRAGRRWVGVDEQARRRVEPSERLRRGQALEPSIADELPHDGAVLRFDPRRNVLSRGARAREFDSLLLAISNHRFVDKLTPVVCVDAA